MEKFKRADQFNFKKATGSRNRAMGMKHFKETWLHSESIKPAQEFTLTISQDYGFTRD